MGGAFVEGLLKSDTILAGDITVADPTEAKLVRYAEQGASVTTNNTIAAQGSDIVAVVVKPWIVQRVIEEIKPVLDYKKQMLVVVAAGVKSEQISGWLDDGAGVLPFFLVIPNIAIAEKQSMTFIVPVGASDSQTATVKGVFDELGGSIVTEERASRCRYDACQLWYRLCHALRPSLSQKAVWRWALRLPMPRKSCSRPSVALWSSSRLQDSIPRLPSIR